MYRMYEMIIDDGQQVFKAVRCGYTDADVVMRYGGNGEIVRIKDVTEDFPISERCVSDALKSFGDAERETVLQCLRKLYVNTVD